MRGRSARSFRLGLQFRQVGVEPILGNSLAPVELLDPAPDFRVVRLAVFHSQRSCSSWSPASGARLPRRCRNRSPVSVSGFWPQGPGRGFRYSSRLLSAAFSAFLYPSRGPECQRRKSMIKRIPTDQGRSGMLMESGTDRLNTSQRADDMTGIGRRLRAVDKRASDERIEDHLWRLSPNAWNYAKKADMRYRKSLRQIPTSRSRCLRGLSLLIRMRDSQQRRLVKVPRKQLQPNRQLLVILAARN